MASTVNSAFDEFLKKTVRLNSEDSSVAESSRDNLISNINGFSGHDDFFNVYEEHNLKFGSFARHTKIKPLDDIDLMICFSATSGSGKRSYTEMSNGIVIHGVDFDVKNNLVTQNTRYLNSTKVINRLLSKLSDLNDYSKAELHKNQEAATLKLKSYTWNYDIVPCFYTNTGLYLIPDGSGNWKKTDPRIDNDRTTKINQNHQGKLLDIIRLMKYWNNRHITLRMGSYLLECMILSVYEYKPPKDNYYVDLEFRDLLNPLSTLILGNIPDPKGFQGNLNTFSIDDRIKISNALSETYKKAKEATNLEISSKDQEAAINKWREIFGYAFPSYTK